MKSKVSSYGIVGLLAVALLAGVGYILLNPTGAEGQGPTGGQGQGRGRSEIVQSDAGTTDGVVYGQGQAGQGQGRGRSEIAQGGAEAADGSAVYGQGQLGQGRGNEGAEAQSQGAFGDAGAFDGSGRNSGAGQGRNETVRNVEWETLTGTVIGIDHEVAIQTAGGEVLIGMGQSAYWADFEVNVGDEITVLGFHEDGEFKAKSVENLDTGETVALRDETGRPMWAGQGQLKNQD